MALNLAPELRNDKKYPKRLNRDLLKFFIGMEYFRWYLVNPHVQTAQKTYANGGQRVFKAELQAAEVDPHF